MSRLHRFLRNLKNHDTLRYNLTALAGISNYSNCSAVPLFSLQSRLSFSLPPSPHPRYTILAPRHVPFSVSPSPILSHRFETHKHLICWGCDRFPYLPTSKSSLRLKFATTLTHSPHPPHHLLLCYPFPPLNIDPNLDLLRLLRFEDREINQIGGILVKDKGEKVRAKGKGKKGKGEKQKPNRREFCF